MEVRNWIKRLSLSQQLFALILIFVTFFTFFFFFYISNNLNTYIETQMFERIDDTQESLLNFYDKGMSISEITSNRVKLIDTYFFKINDKGDISIKSSATKLKKSSSIFKEVYTNLEILNDLNINIDYYYEKGIERTLTSDGTYTYYVIRPIDSHTYIVSLMNNEYANSFKNSLLDNVIDITVFVVGAFFIILMLWVAGIIHPLNQIKNYIEKVKNGEDATLKVNRQDEIGEVADALVDMQADIKKQEKTKEDMIHNISHDLKTPIATIKSYAESIKDGIYPYDTLDKSVDVIIQNADRLEKKVHSLLFMNRVEYILSQDTDNVTCDMAEIVRTVVLNSKVIKPEIEIETNIHYETQFRGSEEAWRVCFENILQNALRYAKTQIVVTLDEDQLCIWNDGPQISEERLGKLFKPYEIGEGGQFGLGLSIVSKVVTASNYEVKAENTEMGGVIFIIKKDMPAPVKIKKNRTNTMRFPTVNRAHKKRSASRKTHSKGNK